MPHEWDKNTPSEGLSRCAKCGIEVKTYRIRKGGLPTCQKFQHMQAIENHFGPVEELEQTKLDEKPPCDTDKTALACLKCPGRLDINLCKNLLKTLKPLKPPLSARTP